VVRQAKLSSDGVVGLAIHKESSESEVAAVERLSGFDKELSAESVIHDGDPELRVIFRMMVQLHGRAEESCVQGRAAAGNAKR
jgi:hypothetical protein